MLSLLTNMADIRSNLKQKQNARFLGRSKRIETEEEHLNKERADFLPLLSHCDISSGALYTRFITSKQKYYHRWLPFIIQAARRCE